MGTKIDVIFRSLLNSVARRFVPESQFSYAQFGEDIILHYLFSQLGIQNPSYLDIGANEPRRGSNTYRFYSRGSSGVLVEPNPLLVSKLSRVRPRDTVINAGVQFNALQEADFYQYASTFSGLGTFSKEDADYWAKVGTREHGKIQYEKVMKIPLVPISTVLSEHFNNRPLNFVSVDVEGLDLEILKTFDFETFKPEAFCVETMSYDDQQKTYKRNDLTAFMERNAYMVFADTRVNTIFARNDLFIA